MNSSFKIPTWYGIEVKAGFEDNEGYYLNPQNKTPNNGLAALGISVPIGQGLLINQRMADLQKAKIQVRLSQAEQKCSMLQLLISIGKKTLKSIYCIKITALMQKNGTKE
jgi:hypothetical protein